MLRMVLYQVNKVLSLQVLHGKTLGFYTYLGYVTLEKCNMILTFSEHWPLIDNSISIYEMLSGIDELI